MPNHFHAIIEVLFSKNEIKFNEFKSPTQSIGATVRGFKGATIIRIKDIINNDDYNKPFGF